MDTLNANVAAQLAERAARHPDRPAITECHQGRSARITFAELARRVRALAAGLAADGIAPGDRVLLFVPMSIDLYAAILACLYAGATAVFVDAWAGRQRLDAAVEAARPTAFIGTPKAHLLRLVSRRVRAIPVHWVAGRRWLRMARHERRPATEEAATVASEAPALVTFTTGSTGRPKAAARSHAFLWAQHEALAAHLALSETDVDMPALPIFVLNNLATGTPSVLPDFDPRRPAEIRPDAIYHQLAAERVTTLGAPPAFCERLARWCAQTGRRLPLRALFTGGAPVLPPLARLLADTVTGDVHVVYGSTEAEPIAGIEVGEMLAAMAPEAGAERPEGICVGRPVPALAVRLLRPHDGPIVLEAGGWAEWEAPAGDVGEVVVAGPHVLGSYLDDPEAERATKMREGDRVWHRTGDAARLDGEGRLWLLGRVKERVVRAGETWWGIPAEIRALEVSGVTHAAFVGLPDPAMGQRAILCVEMANRPTRERGPMPLPAEYERFRAALAPIPIDELCVFQQIPRDPRHASKTDTEALRRLLSAYRPTRG